MQKVLGIGNALVDTMIRMENDELLKELGFPAGSMQLVQEDDAKKIALRCKAFDTLMASGGCAANTIHGLAALGTNTAFIGKVGNDELGEFFIEDLKKKNIIPKILRGISSSGNASAFVTPDGERTFATYLGAALELAVEDLEDELFEGYQYLHVEGYLVQNHSLLEKVFSLAKKHGLKISLDMASFNVVEDNLTILKKWVTDYVDIVFANEEEAKAFTGKEPEDAINDLADLCEIAVVKTGKKGSIIKSGDEKHYIPSIEAKVIDTTGAGDAYAGGVLYGLANGYNLKQCGSIGSLLAGKVIEHMGGRINDEKWPEIKTTIEEILLQE
jgi:sugar/nucleoside kinase (ribokinase family)